MVLKTNIQKYLQGGVVTQVTPKVKEVVNQIPGEGSTFVKNFFTWVVKSNFFLRIKEEDVRELLDTRHLQRTVDEILESRYAIACGEKTAIFITFCRAKRIPAKYAEAVSLEWLEQKSDEKMCSHAFAELFLDGKWVLVDPDKMQIYEDLNYEKRGFVKWAEGVDFRNLKDSKGNYYSWHNLAELRKDTLIFKRRWKIPNYHL